MKEVLFMALGAIIAAAIGHQRNRAKTATETLDAFVKAQKAKSKESEE
jgi:hypothetical protein